MKNTLILSALLASLILFTSEHCPEQTGFRYRTTLNVLESIRPAVSPSTGRTIRGFRLGSVDGTGDIIRSARFGPIQFALPGAGPEFGSPCHDGEVTRRAYSSGLVRLLYLIGDTGGNDISNDENCHCDSRIDLVVFHPFEVVFEDGTSLRIPEGQLTGDNVLCPNMSYALGPKRDFGGKVIATVAVTMRVADDGSALFADVRYDVIKAG